MTTLLADGVNLVVSNVADYGFLTGSARPV